MTGPLDILIRRARLRERPQKPFDIGVTSGRISVIQESTTLDAKTEIDARGNLVTESFVNPHLHLCKE